MDKVSRGRFSNSLRMFLLSITARFIQHCSVLKIEALFPRNGVSLRTTGKPGSITSLGKDATNSLERKANGGVLQTLLDEYLTANLERHEGCFGNVGGVVRTSERKSDHT